jgi:cell wall-associated NlpC family hydrolase
MADTRMIQEIALDQIRRDGGTQARACMDDAVIREYADALTEGAKLPPAVLFDDGESKWLAGGWHRDAAYALIGARTMPCEVRQGTLTDAKLYAYGDNQTHGLRRSNADKRKAVECMLREFGDWSDRKIAQHLGVSHTMVAMHRAPAATVATEAQPDAPKVATVATAEPKKHAPAPAEVATVATPREQPTSGPASVTRPVLTGTDDADDVQEPEDDNPPDDEAAGLLEELQAQNSALSDLVKAAEADDARAETLKWRRAYDNATRQQNEAMERAAAAVKRETWTMTQLRRCGRAVGVDDPAKVAAAVEAAVRGVKAAA